MVGGLINIVSYGFNDLYLTGSPEMTYFKVVYRRHTNFSKESIEVPIGDMNFGEEITVNIPKVADLFTNTYLQLEIPEIWLKKYETADGLTNSELNLLMSPLGIPMSQDEIEIVNSYDDILNFIAINTAGYRIAISNQNVRNQSPVDYIDSIIMAMNYSNKEDENYKNALDRAKIFEQQNGLKDLYIFDNTMSDINLILRELKDKILNDVSGIPYAGYTIVDILNIVIYATNLTIKIKKYFFDKIQKKYKLEQDATSSYAKFAWVEKLGHAIIDHVDINIGGERIDRHYGDWMNVWWELTGNIDQDQMYNKMIGNIDVMTKFDRNLKPKYVLTIPLHFWFCKKAGLAFPLIALQFSPVSMTIKLKEFSECAYIEQLPLVDNEGYELNLTQFTLSDIWDNMGFKINSSLIIEYIYLDNLERKRFAQSAHEYLIETVDRTIIENVYSSDQKVDLEFFGPSKEIIWHVKKKSYVGNESTNIKYPFNYSFYSNDDLNLSKFLHERKKNNPFTKSSLLLNGRERFFNSKFYDKAYYSIIQPMTHHKRTPSEGINMYSFSLYPEEHQPSSACNFTLISNSTMSFGIEKDMFKYLESDINPRITLNSEDDRILTTDLILTIYSVRYNVIRFIGGMGAFAYSYGVTK